MIKEQAEIPLVLFVIESCEHIYFIELFRNIDCAGHLCLSTMRGYLPQHYLYPSLKPASHTMMYPSGTYGVHDSLLR